MNTRTIQLQRPWFAKLKQLARRLLGRPPHPGVIATHPFDLTHGTDTSGLIERQSLSAGHTHDPFITAYFGVPPSRFRNAVAEWCATPETLDQKTYRFIDIGCGKGRALLLASRMPFREVIGIELHPELAATAQRNLAHWKQQLPDLAPTSILCESAPEAASGLLNGPVLIYLYNPFRAPVLRELLNTILTRHESLTAPVDILYLYPEHEDVFLGFPQFQRLWSKQVAIDTEDAGDGLSSATDPCSLYRLTPP